MINKNDIKKLYNIEYIEKFKMSIIIDEMRYFQDLPCYYKDLIYSKLRYYIQPYINTEFNVSKITDSIYISDLPSAFNKDSLKEEGITHILCAILGLEPLYPEEFTYKNVHIRDVTHQDLEPYFDDSVKFIDECIKSGGKILVHCSYGISRSASIVIAYLIKTGLTYTEAYDFVKSKRDLIEPNKGFKKQLLVYGLKESGLHELE